MWRRILVVWLCLLGAALTACEESDVDAAALGCIDLGCQCEAAGGCRSGLTCTSGVCSLSQEIAPGGTTAPGDSEGSPPASPGTASSANSATEPDPEPESEPEPVCETETDPLNCGECGRVCAAAAPEFDGRCPSGGCCQAGRCAPAYSQCLDAEAGFDDCASYCRSIGAECAAEGCFEERTWLGFADAEQCASLETVSARSSGACATPIRWSDNRHSVRCCCTDGLPIDAGAAVPVDGGAPPDSGL